MTKIDIEEVLVLLDNLIAEKGKHLTTLQGDVFREAWNGGKYTEVAKKYGISLSYAREVGSQLWNLLSEVLEEKVCKKNLKITVKRKLKSYREKSFSKIVSSTPSQKPLPTDNSNSSQKIDEVAIQNSKEVSGVIPLESSFYIERPPIEALCYQEISEPGALLRIKGTEKTGKTSLIMRIIAQAELEGYQTASLNFELADKQILSSLDRFLKWFCSAIALKLELPNKMDDYWDEMLGPKTSCDTYLKKYLLAKIERPLVVTLDNVDDVLLYPEIAVDFFSLIRSWYEGAKINEVLKKVRLVLVHSPQIYLPVNLNQSPFNVGCAIELAGFNQQQINEIAQKYGTNLTIEQIQKLIELIEGHPYLVQITLHQLTHKNFNFNQIMKLAPTDQGIYKNHLRRYLRKLEQEPKLMSALEKILSETSTTEINSLEMFKLHRMGLIKLKENQIQLSCSLYEQYFGQKLAQVT